MQSQPQQPALDDFLTNIPPYIAATFTRNQLEAIAAALEKRKWQRHPVDIRLSLPCLWKRFYVVFIAGEERRSPDRRKAEVPLWTPANIVTLCCLACVGGLASLSLVLLAQTNWAFLSQNYSTIIPFKEDQASCEESGRVWREDQCYDDEHDPVF